MSGQSYATAPAVGTSLGLQALGTPTPVPRASTAVLHDIGRAAVASLYDELALWPKPGLVSFVDAGSHRDMDATTFMRSLFALRHYFPKMAVAGAGGATGSAFQAFEVVEAIGIDAERRMLRATGGVNTHRGAIFTLGLLCASAGALRAQGRPAGPVAVRETLRTLWGEALRARRVGAVGENGAKAAKGANGSNGQRAAVRDGLRGARDEAALAFPTVFECAVPALAQARRQRLDDRHARVQALFHIIAVLDDTNLAHRGGLAGLRWAQAAARGFLSAGGAARPDALEHAAAIHRDFVARRLSPGGAADVLAAVCLLERIGERADESSGACTTACSGPCTTERSGTCTTERSGACTTACSGPCTTERSCACTTERTAERISAPITEHIPELVGASR